MKKLLVTLSVAGLFLSSVSGVLADDKEKTIKGEIQCAKCTLKKADACQNAIIQKEDGKEVTYLLEGNDVSKKFHKNVCAPGKKAKAKATGTVKEEGGKRILVAKQIELVESK